MEISRSEFLKRLFVTSFAAFGITALLEACGGNEEKQPVQKNFNDPCGDLTGLTEAEIQTRKQFEYVPATPDKEKTCSNCAHYVLPKEGNVCGTCQLVKGPINANGYCNQWFKKV